MEVRERATESGSIFLLAERSFYRRDRFPKASLRLGFGCYRCYNTFVRLIGAAGCGSDVDRLQAPPATNSRQRIAGKISSGC
jgi:hypothetical protein